MPNFLDSLFPRNPAYDGLLAVDHVRKLQNASLMRAGVNTMGAGNRGAPLGAALSEGAGPEMAGWGQQLDGAAAGAMRMSAYQDQQTVKTKRQQIVQQNPQQPNEPEIEWLKRLYPLFMESGDTEILARLTQLISATGQLPAVHYEEGVGEPGTPEAGQPGMYRMGRTGAAERVPGMAIPPKGKSEAQLAVENQRAFYRENQLVDDYDRTTRPWLVPYGALQRGLQDKDAALAGNGPAQIQLMYAFISTLDNSVVKEGEVTLAREAAPVMDRARQYADKYARNRAAVMPPELTEQMVAILERVEGSFADRFDNWRKHYTKRAGRWGVDPESFIDLPGTMRPGTGSAPKGQIGF